jgi:TPP-dependent pyruvate/acetoin dehydrogenase alpha subunit
MLSSGRRLPGRDRAAARRWSKPSAIASWRIRPTREEVEERRKEDPIPRFERLLGEGSILTPEGLEALKRGVLEEVNDATDRAEAMAYPAASDLFERVYADSWDPWGI